MSGGVLSKTQATPTPAANQRRPGESARERGIFQATRGWSAPEAAPSRLRIGRPNDPCEAEADAAAAHALAEPAKEGAPSLGSTSGKGIVRGKLSSWGSPVAPTGLDRHIAAAAGEGQALDREQRNFFEPRFNRDFAAVRVHAGPSAAKAANKAGAQAFALGDDIFFGAGEYRPESEPGRRLLAHELAHTIQERPNVIARRALPAANDLQDAPADAEPVPRGADEAATGLADAPEGADDVAREGLAGLDSATRMQALARMRARLPAGETGKASDLARKEAEKPEAKGSLSLPGQRGGGAYSKTATPGEQSRGVETRAESTAPAHVDNVPGAPIEAPIPVHERASASAASKMQEAIRTVSGEAETGGADSQLAVAPDAPMAEGGGGGPARSAGAAAAAQRAIALLGERLAELEGAKSLPIHFQEDSGGPPGDPVAFARQRESAALAASFVQRASGKIETVIAAALAAPAAAMSALDAARAEISGQVAAQGAAIQGDADKSRKNVNSQAARVRSSIEAKQGGADSAATADVRAARDRAQTSRDGASTKIGKRADTEKERISKGYTDAAAPMTAVGDDAAGKAAAAAATWKRKLPPYETDWSILDGPVENERIDAKKEAVDKVAAEYGKSFRESAKDQASKIPVSKPEVLAKVDDITRQAGAGLTAQLEQISQGASAQEKGAKAQSNQSAQKMKAALNSSAAQNLSALDAAEKEHSSALAAQGAGAEDALDKSTAAGISGLADGVSQASKELIGSIHSFVGSAADMPSPPREGLAAALDETSANIEGPVGAMASQIATVAPSLAQTNAALSEQGAGALTATAAAARQGFEGVATAFATNAAGINQQAAQGFAALSKSNRKAADGIGAQAEAGFLEAGGNAAAAYKSFGDLVEDNFRIGREQMLGGLWGKETQGKLNTDMDKYAEEAASHVQPRWKSVLKWVVTIVVIVAVIAITVATAGALGPVGVVLLGAALGAAAGAVQTIANNLIDGKPWSEGVVKAMIVGAIGGAVGGAGGVLLKGVGSLALKIGLEAGINIVGGVAGEAVGSLAVGETINWTGALMGALIGAGVGAGLGIAGALKGKIRIGGIGEPVGAAAPRPVIEPPPAPAGKLRSFLEQSKILAPRPGAPVPEVNIGAGAGGNQPAPRAPSAAPKTAEVPLATPEVAAPQPRRAIGLGDRDPIAPTPEPAAGQPRQAIGFGRQNELIPSTPELAPGQPRQAIGFGRQNELIPATPEPAPGQPRQAIGFGRQNELIPSTPEPAPGQPRQAIGFGRQNELIPATPEPAPGQPRQAIGFGRQNELIPATPEPAAGSVSGAPVDVAAAPRRPAILHEPSAGRPGGMGGPEPIRAGGRSTFEPRAIAEPAGGGKPSSGEHGIAEPARAKPLEPAEAATAKKPIEPPVERAPAKAKASAKAEEVAPSAKPEETPSPKPEESTQSGKPEEAAPSAKAEEAAPPAKAEEAAPSAKSEKAAPPAKPEPFDTKQIGAKTEAPQILAGESFSSVKLQPGQDALYILRDAEGTVLKVGKTSESGAVNRFSVYKRGAKLVGIEVELEVHPLKASGRSAEFYERALRQKMEDQGHAMPWDNTDQRLGRPGFGTPGEGVRTSHLTKGEMAELLEMHKGNLREVGKELGLHSQTVRLWAKALGLVPKDFK